jgi:CBS domain-containing protein
MTDLERFETTRETLATTAERANPAPERYDSALARYLAAVGNPRAHEPRHDNSLRDELYWNVENKLVSDVMAHAVVSVDEDATFKEIVEALARRRVSAVAVVDGERKVIGVISESDPLAKMVAGGDPRVPVRGGHSTRVQTRRESHAETACDRERRVVAQHRSGEERDKLSARRFVNRHVVAGKRNSWSQLPR